LAAALPADVPQRSSQHGLEESSERVRLARVALQAALSVPGVVRGDSGRMHVHATPVGDSERLDGVMCAALAEGGYEVALRLVAQPVPLQPLARRIGERVERSAGVAGLGAALRSVSVHFADIEPGPLAA
jgi:hypothetical protein